MPDIVVQSHIDNFLKSSDTSGARSAIGTYGYSEVPTIAQFNALNTTVGYIDGSLVNVSNLSGSTYTLSLSDLGYYIRKSHTSTHTIIIPTSTSVPFAVGSTFIIRNASSNTLTISASPSVALTYYADLSANILDQNASAQIVCVGTDSWDII